MMDHLVSWDLNGFVKVLSIALLILNLVPVPYHPNYEQSLTFILTQFSESCITHSSHEDDKPWYKLM